jgi:hypothetical protein
MEKWRDFLILVHHLSGIFVILLIFFFCAQSPLSYLISHPFVIKGMSFFFFFLSFGSDDRIRLTHKRETGIRVVAFVSLVSLLLF